jgi:hypothetical protein
MSSERDRVLGMFPAKDIELLEAVTGYLMNEGAHEALVSITGFRPYAQVLSMPNSKFRSPARDRGINPPSLSRGLR